MMKVKEILHGSINWGHACGTSECCDPLLATVVYVVDGWILDTVDPVDTVDPDTVTEMVVL